MSEIELEPAGGPVAPLVLHFAVRARSDHRPTKEIGSPRPGPPVAPWIDVVTATTPTRDARYTSPLMRSAAIIAATAAVALAGCGASGSHAGGSASKHSRDATASAASPAPQRGKQTVSGVHCAHVGVPAPKPIQHLRAPTLRLDPAKTYRISVVTTCGSFAFELDVKQSPKTSASFYYLVKRGFYNGLTFHRVAAGFVIQGGDPQGNGSGGPGYTVVEAPPAGTQYLRGDVAMAKTQTQPSGASGSQFFIVLGSNAGLPPQYALAGKVISGISVVEAIGSLPTDPAGDGYPSPPVVMTKVTVTAF